MPRALQYGAFGWNADTILAAGKAGTLWAQLSRRHVDDLLLGLDSEDIAKYATPSGSAAMNAFVDAAHGHGARVELLLGDPSWIPPAGIPSLKGIIRKLARIRFDGLNLDLEPNQVREPIQQSLAQLVDAMSAYVAASPWPVTLDANWIYVKGGAKFDHGYCFMCGLQHTGLKHVALMIYIADPKTVSSIAAPLAHRSPWAGFSVAQSVEPPGVLTPRDSYWSVGFTQFYADMHALDGEMRSTPNYEGITIQSWRYLGKLLKQPNGKVFS